MTLKEFAAARGLSEQRVRLLASQGRIKGAVQRKRARARGTGLEWFIPARGKILRPVTVFK